MPFTFAFEPLEIPLDGRVIVVRVASEADGELWDSSWKGALTAARTDDAEWDWAAQISRGDFAGFLCLAAVSETRLEGLLSLRLGQSRVARGSQLVYIEYVSTAPWNRRDVVRRPEIRGLGRVLIQMALRVSIVLGFEGRIGLHSKPAVETFYREKLGLVDLGVEVVEDGEWVYFEATPEVARRLV